MPRGKYRKRKTGSDTWHFCTNCTLWPASDYDERDTEPTSDELCNQCKDKEKNSACNYA